MPLIYKSPKLGRAMPDPYGEINAIASIMEDRGLLRPYPYRSDDDPPVHELSSNLTIAYCWAKDEAEQDKILARVPKRCQIDTAEIAAVLTEDNATYGQS